VIAELEDLFGIQRERFRDMLTVRIARSKRTPGSENKKGQKDQNSRGKGGQNE
jgi:hypothetical protein